MADEIKKMQTVKPGMTRRDLLKVFGPEGGLFQRERQSYASRDCPYFKVDVVFKASDGTKPGPNVPIVKEERDVITKISKPYLEFSRID